MLFSESGLIKLCDFGLAIWLEQISSKIYSEGSSSWYLAPEVFDDEIEMKSDVWSLGISLIELAERNPYAELSSHTIKERVCGGEPPSLSSSKWSAEFVDFVNKCLVKDVKERWSVSALLKV